MHKWWHKGLSIYQSLLWVIISIFIFSGIPALYVFFKDIERGKKQKDPEFIVKHLLVKSPQEDHVPSELFVHLLRKDLEGVSLVDLPIHSIEEKLTKFPIFENVNITPAYPDALLIDYQMKVPFMFLEDVENGAIDQRGVLIPFSPYFSPKNLPKLNLGVEASSLSWGESLNSQNLQLAWDLFNFFEKNFAKHWELKNMDLREVQNDSGSIKQFALYLRNNLNQSEWKLKLVPESFEMQLIRFEAYVLVLERGGEFSQNEIDLRLSPMMVHQIIPIS